MFEQFPKQRPPLPQKIAEIYANQYKENREGKSTAASMAQRMEAWLHRQVAADVTANPLLQRSTLEIGAGTLNQLQHEPAVGPYDIVEPFSSLFEKSPLLARVRKVHADISEVDPSQRYDRITTVATFEHVLNLPQVVAKCGLMLNEGGTLRVSIPSEGTFLWTLGWKLTTGLEFRLKHGLDYGDLMRHEHVNTAKEIEAVLRHFFARVDSKAFGLCKAVSLYQFHLCSQPRLELCRQFA